MNTAYKYRIYPDYDQIILIEKTFGCCRKVWNLMLSDKISHYNSTGKSLSSMKKASYLKKDRFSMNRQRKKSDQ